MTEGRQEDWFRAALAKCDLISKTKEGAEGKEKGRGRGSRAWLGVAVYSCLRTTQVWRKKADRQAEGKGFPVLFCF